MLSLKDFSDKVIQNSKREPDNGRSGFGLVTPSKQPLGDPRTSREFTGWLSKQGKSNTPIMPPKGVVSAMAKGGKVNSSRVTEVGEDGPELLVNNTVVPLNKHDRQVGQKRGNLPKGNLSALLSHIRHREYGGDVPDDGTDDTQNFTPNDTANLPTESYSPNQPDTQPDTQQRQMPQQAAQPVQRPVQQEDQPDTGDIYSQIAQGYAQKIAALTNKDYGAKHHGGIGTILKGAGIGALQGLAHSDPRNGFAAELGAAVGGAGTGGVAGGIDSSNPQRAIDQMRLQKLQSDAAENQKLGLGQAQLEDEQAKPEDRQAAIQQKRDQQTAITQRQLTAFNNRMAIHAQDADVKAGIAKNFIDANGKVWKQYLRADSTGKTRPNEPVVNPTTGEQEVDPGEQMIPWADPRTGKVISVKAKQIVGPEATMYTGEQNRTAAADRQQAGFSHSEKMLELQDNYRKGFAEYQKTLDDMKAARDAQTKADLTTKANQQKATLMGLRTQLHLIEQEQKNQ